MRNAKFVPVILFFAATMFAACTDENDNSKKKASEGEAESVGSMTIISMPVEDAEIILNEEETGHRTPQTFHNLSLGLHQIELKLAGRRQADIPLAVSLTAKEEDSDTPQLLNVEIFLYRELSGGWKDESGARVEAEMEIVTEEYEYLCPDTPLSVRGFDPVGSLCVEKDDTLSLCKTHDAKCGEQFAQGRIADDGNVVEFTVAESEKVIRYTRLPTM